MEEELLSMLHASLIRKELSRSKKGSYETPKNQMPISLSYTGVLNDIINQSIQGKPTITLRSIQGMCVHTDTRIVSLLTMRELFKFTRRILYSVNLGNKR